MYIELNARRALIASEQKSDEEALVDELAESIASQVGVEDNN